MTPQPAKPHPSTQRDLLELAVAYLLIMATIWTADPTQRILYWLAFAWIVGTSWARPENWTALGLGRKGLLQSLWIVALALCLSAITIYIAWRSGTLHHLYGPTPIFEHGWAYIVWSLMQEFILQSYFLVRFLRLLPNKASAILAAAGIFALAHLPNPILTPITLIWGTISCILFLRYRNIYALGIAHGIMGLSLAVAVPSSLHHHMRVGLGYLHYHQRNEDRHLLLLRRHPERSEGSPHLLLPWLLSLPLFVFRRHPDPGEQSLHHDHLLFRRHSDPERQPNGSESQYFVVACSHPWDQRNQSGNAEPQTTAPDAKLPNTRYLSPATDNEQRPQR